MDAQMGKSSTFRPKFRYALKGRIHMAGFRTLGEFSEKIGVDIARVSRVVCGWEGPSPKMQQSMAATLGITIRELKELL